MKMITQVLVLEAVFFNSAWATWYKFGRPPLVHLPGHRAYAPTQAETIPGEIHRSREASLQMLRHAEELQRLFRE